MKSSHRVLIVAFACSVVASLVLAIQGMVWEALGILLMSSPAPFAVMALRRRPS